MAYIPKVTYSLKVHPQYYPVISDNVNRIILEQYNFLYICYQLTRVWVILHAIGLVSIMFQSG